MKNIVSHDPESEKVTGKHIDMQGCKAPASNLWTSLPTNGRSQKGTHHNEHVT